MTFSFSLSSVAIITSYTERYYATSVGYMYSETYGTCVQGRLMFIPEEKWTFLAVTNSISVKHKERNAFRNKNIKPNEVLIAS